MKKLLLPCLSIIIIAGCTIAPNKKNNISDLKYETVKLDSFFPVTSFIKGQLTLLKNEPITPLQVVTINNKSDSTWIKMNRLLLLLSPFLSPEIKETNFSNLFKQTSFKDQTINTITFTYSPSVHLPDSITLKHWDIYIDPESGKLIKLYLVKTFKGVNEIITQQLTWQTGKWAKITTLLNKPGNKPSILKEEKFIWNFDR